MEAKCEPRKSNADCLAFERRQGFDHLAHLSLRQAKLIDLLKVEPKVGAGAEEMGEPQGGVPGNAAVAVEDLSDSTCRRRQPAREFGGAHFELFQLFSQVYAWVDYSC